MAGIDKDDVLRVLSNYRGLLISAACGLCLWAVKCRFRGARCTNNVGMKGKTVIITGANTGIGKETARELAKRGARIIMACRSKKRGENAANYIRSKVGECDVVVKHLDLASLSSVNKFADEILLEEDRLDVLINNAGIYGCPYWKTNEGFEMQLGVNHLGHFLLTNRLLTLLANSAPSRIIVLSSSLFKRGVIDFHDFNLENNYHPAKAYSRSKLANILFVHELSKRLPSGVIVNAVSPGIVWTDLGRHVKMNPFIKLLFYPVALLFMKSSWYGAQCSIFCATEPELENVSGKYFRECQEAEISPVGLDDATAKRLWLESEKYTGLLQQEDHGKKP